MTLEHLKTLVQSSHINFLLGSGLSRPYLNTLGDIEKLLTESVNIVDDDMKTFVQASILGAYFSGVMFPCTAEEIAKKQNEYDAVLNTYINFLSIWNNIVARRSSSILGKQVNIFTTNIDNFIEAASEKVGIEFNDGFKGQMNPTFREDTFSNVISKVSTLYHNSSVVPSFNYMKIHGSITWTEGKDDKITYDRQLKTLSLIDKAFTAIPKDILYLKLDQKKLSDLTGFYSDKIGFSISDDETELARIFLKAYENLIMINPRKTKFQESVLSMHFYELMRLFSNAMEKTGSTLFVAGFSFADEHLASLTLRAANNNPTLQIIVFAYNESDEVAIKGRLKVDTGTYNNNILVISPESFKKGLSENEKERYKSDLGNLSNFDLASLNKFVFSRIV